MAVVAAKEEREAEMAVGAREVEKVAALEAAWEA